MSLIFENKTMVVTGATSGIGFAVSRELAGQGTFVIAVGRIPDKCRDAEERIRLDYPEARLTFLSADISSQEAVVMLADAISSVIRSEGKSAINALIHIAGTFTSRNTSTHEGIETQFAVNHLAPFLLTHRLMPFLKAAPEARVITMSSGSHYHTRIHWNDIFLKKHYNCLLAYKQSKLCNVLFSLELKKRTQNTDISVFAADPGLVNTDMGLKNATGIAKWVWSLRKNHGVPPEKAAHPIAWLAAETSISNSDQLYWKNRQPKSPSRQSQNPETALRLWKLSEKLCRIDSKDYGL